MFCNVHFMTYKLLATKLRTPDCFRCHESCEKVIFFMFVKCRACDFFLLPSQLHQSMWIEVGKYSI